MKVKFFYQFEGASRERVAICHSITLSLPLYFDIVIDYCRLYSFAIFVNIPCLFFHNMAEVLIRCNPNLSFNLGPKSADIDF